MKNSTELIIEYLDRNPIMSKAITTALVVFTAFCACLIGEEIGTALGHILNFVGA